MKLPPLLSQPVGPKTRRMLLVVPSVAVAVLIASFVWALIPHSRKIGESPAQSLRQLEQTYGCMFPTNISIQKHKAWMQTVPRGSDIRIRVVQFTCNRSVFDIFQNTLGTNFIHLGSAITPGAFYIDDQAPWVQAINENWKQFSCWFDKPDPDQWPRHYKLGIYVTEMDSTNSTAIVLSEDTRSERNF